MWWWQHYTRGTRQIHWSPCTWLISSTNRLTMDQRQPWQTERYANLTFIGPCILIYFYSNSNKAHQYLNLFYFLKNTLYMFRTVFPSIIRSSRLYAQQQASVKQNCWLLASKQTSLSVWQMPVAVRTVLNSWWWTERPSETCRVFFKNKIETLVHLVGFGIKKWRHALHMLQKERKCEGIKVTESDTWTEGQRILLMLMESITLCCDILVLAYIRVLPSSTINV